MPFDSKLTPPLVVQKFGGTSVATIGHIQRVALRALETQRAGNQVVVVVSAMSGETNRLLALGHQASDLADTRELDALAATGEQASAALTAIAIREAGGKARSFLGHQIRILTDSRFGDAAIRSVETASLESALANGEIPVVAGFQGVDETGSLTTLGRGGSDTSAVAVAAALRATVCEIYTDVDGVYTADPRICPEARKLQSVSYHQMLTMAALGAKVLHEKCVAMAMKHRVSVHVRSSFSNESGTWIVATPNQGADVAITGLACDRNATQVRLGTEASPETIASLFTEYRIPAEGITDEKASRSFLLRPVDLPRARVLLAQKGWNVADEEPVAKVSLVGSRLRSETSIMRRVTGLLAKERIGIRAIDANEDHITTVVRSIDSEMALRTLHNGLALNAMVEDPA